MTGKQVAILVGAAVVVGAIVLYDDKKKAYASTGPAPSPGRPGRRRGVDALEPATREKFLELQRRLAAKGIKIVPGSTRRTRAEELEHFRQGRSSIASGLSWHLLGRAIDAYPIDPKTGQPDLMGRNIELFRAMHREWAALGGRGIAFDPYPDGPPRRLKGAKGFYWDGGHLEYHGPHRTIAQAYQAEKATVIEA